MSSTKTRAVADDQRVPLAQTPHRGTAGWHVGTDRWEDGAFFRYEINRYHLIDLTR
jgi:hypothetical protein